MQITISKTKLQCGTAAADDGGSLMRAAIRKHGSATIILATGASQIEMFRRLVRVPGIDWSKVTAFHLDEYVGLPEDHPASFRHYLKERFVDKLPIKLGWMHWIDPGNEPEEACERLASRIKDQRVDVAFIGIGENGHLAFNDPPADFETEERFRVVELDEASRRQQVGEGWFDSVEDVPERAITMTVPQILKSDAIICTVPDARKSEAVGRAVEGPVTPDVPASALQTHDAVQLYLDLESAVRLSEEHRTDVL